MGDRAGRMLAATALAAVGLVIVAAPGWARFGDEGTDLGSAHGLNYRVNHADDFVGTGFDSFVACLEGETAVSGGVKISGTGLQGRMGSSRPETDEGGLGGGADIWRSTASDLTQPQTDIGFYAVCKKSGPGGLKYRHETRNVKPGKTKTVKAACPGGYRVIGGGLLTADPVVLATVPFDGGDGNEKQDDGWKAKAISDYGLKTEFTTYAVCPEAGTWDLAYEDGGANHNIFLDPNSTLLLGRSCGVGDVVIGGGGEILGPSTNGRIHESHPGTPMSFDGGWSVGLTNLTASTVTARAYTICKQ